MIELRVLGTLALHDRSRDAPVASVLAQPKRTALLCRLALAGRRAALRRDTILPLFWPESTEERARNSLNQAIFQLRRSLGDDVITGTAEDVALNPAAVWCDVVAFEDALAQRDDAAALSLYGGHLLPGFHLDGCSEFEHWLDGERERLRRSAVGASLRSATAQEEAGNGIAALDALRRAAEWAPYDEAVAARLVTLLARLGDRAGALQHGEQFRQRLDADLALAPSPEFEALAAAIRRQSAAQGVGAAGLADGQAERDAAADAAVRTGPPVLDVAPPAAQWAEEAQAPTAALERGRASPRRRERLAAAAVVLVMAVALLRIVPGSAPPSGVDAVASRSAADAPAPLDARRVLVAGFENRTGDEALAPLGYMAADWIAQGIAHTGLARVVPLTTLMQEIQVFGGGVADSIEAGALARRLGAGLLVAGSYYRSGDEILIQAQIVDVASGELLRSLPEVRVPRHAPAAAAAELQHRSMGAVAGLFDERLQSWPDPGAQPSSLEAYQLFADGMRLFLSGNREWGTPGGAQQIREAADRFMRAGRADSMFTTAPLWAGYAFLSVNDSAAARAILTGLEHRALPSWSRAVANHQRAALDGDAEREFQAARELAELSPDTEWLFALGLSAYRTGRHRTALDAFLRIDPDRGWIRGLGSYWRLRAELQHVVGHYDAALHDTGRGLAVSPADSWLQTQELWALAALGRAEEIMQRVAPGIASDTVFRLWQLTTAVEELRGHGHDASARRLLEQAIPLARAAADRLRSNTAHGQLAWLLNQAGQSDEAAALWQRLAGEEPATAEYRIRLAIEQSRRGNHRAAQATLNWLRALSPAELERAYPPAQRGYWGSAEGWRALNEARLLAHEDEDGAIVMLRTAIARGLDHAYLHLHDDPDFAHLRGRPAFQALLRARD
jgi:DNA-binding SARP family transcriptional activator/TolB-like protein